MILGENGEKMSKSRGNVVNPDDVIGGHGADALRMYLMFLGPLDRDKPWNTKGIEGVRRFLDRVWRLYCDNETDELLPSLQGGEPDEASLKILHRCIAEVTDRTENLLFNTAISSMMVFVNEMNQLAVRPRKVMEQFLLLLAPYAPHLCEELWRKLGHQKSLTYAAWPELDEQYLVEDLVTYVVQVNGKVREKLEVAADAGEDAVREAALASEKVQKWLEGKEHRRHGAGLVYRLRKPTIDGRTELILTPLELLDRLAHLVTPPRRTPPQTLRAGWRAPPPPSTTASHRDRHPPARPVPCAPRPRGLAAPRGPPPLHQHLRGPPPPQVISRAASSATPADHQTRGGRSTPPTRPDDLAGRRRASRSRAGRLPDPRGPASAPGGHGCRTPAARPGRPAPG